MSPYVVFLLYMLAILGFVGFTLLLVLSRVDYHRIRPLRQQSRVQPSHEQIIGTIMGISLVRP